MDNPLSKVEGFFTVTIRSVYSLIYIYIVSICCGWNGAIHLQKRFEQNENLQIGPYATLLLSFALPTISYIFMLDKGVIEQDPNRAINIILGDYRLPLLIASFLPTVVFDFITQAMFLALSRSLRRNSDDGKATRRKQAFYYAIAPFVLITASILYVIQYFEHRYFILSAKDFASLIYMSALTATVLMYIPTELNRLLRRQMSTVFGLIWKKRVVAARSRILFSMLSIGIVIGASTSLGPMVFFKTWQILSRRAIEIQSLACDYTGNEIHAEVYLKNNGPNDAYINNEVGNVMLFTGDNNRPDADKVLVHKVIVDQDIAGLKIEIDSDKTAKIDIWGKLADNPSIKYDQFGPRRCLFKTAKEDGVDVSKGTFVSYKP